MSVWSAVRSEVTGAWRSVRYDLARRGGHRPAHAAEDPEFDPFEGGPRRVIVSAGVTALVVGGAVGSYFGVVNGLGALMDRAPAPAALPAVAGEDDVTPVAPRERPDPGQDGGARGDRPAPPGGTDRAVGRATVPGPGAAPGAGVTDPAGGAGTDPGAWPGAGPDAEPWPPGHEPGFPGFPAFPGFPEPEVPEAADPPGVPVPTPAPSGPGEPCEEPPSPGATPIATPTATPTATPAVGPSARRQLAPAPRGDGRAAHRPRHAVPERPARRVHGDRVQADRVHGDRHGQQRARHSEGFGRHDGARPRDRGQGGGHGR